MWRIRGFETRAMQLFEEKLIRGSVHPYIGMEAVAVGACAALGPQDYSTSTHRGHGHSNQGLLHEAANLAAVLDAPVVYICENNQWAISTPVATATRISDIADRAAGYGFPGVVADGNDVLEMREVTTEAVARARAGDGPTLIEAKSYRITPHSAATQTDLRDPAELDEWRARDPILRFARRLADDGTPGSRLEELEAQAKAEVDAAVEWALESPRPEPGQEIEDVYAPSEWTAPGRLS